MKSLSEHLWFNVPQRRGLLNITRTVEELVRRSNVQEGLCLINAIHITTSVYINDAEDGLLHDYESWREKLAPHEPASQYQHNRYGARSGRCDYGRKIGHGPLGTNFLWRIRSPALEACFGKNHSEKPLANQTSDCFIVGGRAYGGIGRHATLRW